MAKLEELEAITDAALTARNSAYDACYNAEVEFDNAWEAWYAELKKQETKDD